jgi:sugar lactone lactonase YvrE
MPIEQFGAEHLFSSQATLGEGPIWDQRCESFWWIDIAEKKLFRYSLPLRTNREWQLDQMPGAVVLRKSGGVMLALQHGFAAFDPTTGKIEMKGDPEQEKFDNRFNDGECDPAGRFWAGTMRIEDHMSKFTGSLYSLETDGRIVLRLGSDLGVSNGIAWTKDETTMYLVDSPRSEIYSFKYDKASGKIWARECIFKAPQELGYPDGMAIDTDDKLWVAFWGGWCVARICPQTSRLLAKVAVPVSAPTSCAFGGPDRDQLLITTASIDLDEHERARQPYAGDLFLVKLPVRGARQTEYAG